MKFVLKRIHFIVGLFGFNPIVFINFFRGFPSYLKDYIVLSNQLNKGKKVFSFGSFYPIFDDKFSESASIRSHYFHQDLLVAQRVYANKPQKHIDIGSRIDGFVAHVAAFRPIEIYDIRPLKSEIYNVVFRQANLMNLEENMKNSCDSISSLHAIEHFGLGRYGDPIDFEGHLKGINNIYLMLKKGGKFYFSVPIGPQRIEFNAHRVFSVKYLLEIFKDKFEVVNFNYVDDKGDLYTNVLLENEAIETNFNCNYGCGIFELSKI